MASSIDWDLPYVLQLLLNAVVRLMKRNRYCDPSGAVEGGVFIRGMVAVPPGDTSAMAATVQQYGAVITVIQVLEDFVLYAGGVSFTGRAPRLVAPSFRFRTLRFGLRLNSRCGSDLRQPCLRAASAQSRGLGRGLWSE